MNASWALAGVPHIFGQVLHPLPPPYLPYILSIYGTPRRLVRNIQAMDGLFLAFRRDCIAQLRWDADTFDAFHIYDVDVTFRAHLAGYKLAVACDLPVLHSSHGAFDDRWKTYAQRFFNKHHTRLAPIFLRKHEFGTLQLPSRQHALLRMSPPHWPPDV
jgi:GT2 family glycosyltransferase